MTAKVGRLGRAEATTPLATARRRLEKHAAMALGGFGALCLLAAFVIPVSGAVIVQGALGARGDNLVLQHPDGGRVARVLVRDGTPVKAGDPILELDGAALRTEADRLARQKLELSVRLARLRASVAGKSDFVAPGLRGRLEGEPRDGEEAAIVATQAEALRAERALLAAQIARAERRAAGARSARATLQGQIAAAQARRALIVEEIQDLSALVDEQLLSRTRLGALQREELEVRQRLEALRLDADRLDTEAVSADLEAASLRRADMDRTWRDIEESERKLGDVERQWRMADERIARLIITAPADGLVHELAVKNQGAALAPGGAVAKIVPQDAGQQIRVRLPVSAIDDVALGQTARVRFDTVGALRHSTWEASVTSLSPDRSIDTSTGEPYVNAALQIVETDRMRLAAAAPETGAPVTVMIATRRRPLALYLLEPLLDAFTRTFATA